MGHEFRPFTANSELAEVLKAYNPDLFIISSNHYCRRYIDFELLRRFRDEGLVVLVKIDFWTSPLSRLRINEAPSLKDDKKGIDLITSGLMGDAFFHVVEQEDARMNGFSSSTGYNYHTIPLAADKTLCRRTVDPRFRADISYVGTALPEKRDFFKKNVMPFKECYDLRIYGQDWSLADRSLGWLQRLGQYLNIGSLARLRKPKLAIEDEGLIYASSLISINVHEDYQRRFGGDCNERTFKIPLFGGFQVVDDVACLSRYFEVGKEILVAKDSDQWFELINHYLRYPDSRRSIMEAGFQRVLRDHTYHNRVEQMIKISESLSK
jgi:spore maturation protein CgeB